LAATWWFVRQIYPIPYERRRLGKITCVAVAVSLSGIAVRALVPPHMADIACVALLAAFPVGLMGIGVFRRTEIASLRAWMHDNLKLPLPGSGVS
jgi:hypothetical protein